VSQYEMNACLRDPICHDLAKWLSHYLIFLFFSFLLVSNYHFSFSFLLFSY